MKSVLTRNGRLRVWVVPTLVALIVVCAVAAMLIGRFSVSLEDVIAALRARFWGGPSVPPRVNSVVFDLRAPRIIVAILIGGGLSVAGASFQSLFSNPWPHRTPWGSRRARASARSSPCCWTGT